MHYTSMSRPELLARRIRGVCLECGYTVPAMDAMSGFAKDLCEGCLTQERKERAAAKKKADREAMRTKRVGVTSGE